MVHQLWLGVDARLARVAARSETAWARCEAGIGDRRQRARLLEGCRRSLADHARAALLGPLCRRRHKVHKARNTLERMPGHLHATVRKALRQAWEIGDAARAEQLMKNLARRQEREAPGVAASIREGLDEILMVTRLGLPGSSADRSPAPTSSRI
jgi:hypothetical protein